MQVLKHIGAGVEFSDFVENKTLRCDEVYHQAKIEINEEGSDASAVTMLLKRRSHNPFIEGRYHFICNKPFLFLIYDKKSKEILFSGVYREPNQ